MKDCQVIIQKQKVLFEGTEIGNTARTMVYLSTPRYNIAKLTTQITTFLYLRNFTPTLQKSRMPQVLGVVGEAVVLHREPSTTPPGGAGIGDAG